MRKRIASINMKGWELTLEDGASWSVAPCSWQTAKMWKKTDHVRAIKGNNRLFSYTLENVDSGDVVLANPKCPATVTKTEISNI